MTPTSFDGTKDITTEFVNNVWTAPSSGLITVYLEPSNTTFGCLRYTRNDSQMKGLCVNSTNGALSTGVMPVRKGDVIKRVLTIAVNAESISFDAFE